MKALFRCVLGEKPQGYEIAPSIDIETDASRCKTNLGHFRVLEIFALICTFVASM
jgi:hypothetical protein